MLAMLRKDLYVMKGMMIVYAVMWAGLAAILAWVPDAQRSSLAYILPLLSANTVLYSLDADEKYRWDVFIAVTPLQPKDIVLAKYLLAYGNAVLMAATGFLANWASSLGKVNGYWTLSPILFVLLWGIMFMPLRYRFTRGQASLCMFLIWGAAAALLLNPFGLEIADFLFGWVERVPRLVLAAIILAAAMAVNVVSIKLSIRWYTWRRRIWCD